MSRSLYDKIDGFGAVSGIVLNFYDKVLESEVVAPYFASVDMPRLIDHQTQFICSLLGGPASIPDEHIRHVHRNMGVSAAAFDQAVALFREALSEAELDEPDIDRAVALFEAKRPLVVRGWAVLAEAAAGADLEYLDALTLGILVCAPESLAIRFANGRAKSWFGPELEGKPLSAVIPAVSESAVAEQHDKDRVFTATGEAAPPKAKRVAFRLSIAPKRLGKEQLLVAAIEDITKLKEQEHLLASFSRMVDRKTREIEKERERAEKLLMNVFPYSVLQEFKEFGTTTPSFYDDVSVMFLDFVGFTRMPVSRQPKQLIAELNDIFSTFDQITEHHSCERIKTIGDAYLAVSGMPTPNPDHAVDITRAAIKILRYLLRRNLNHPIQWTCRIGIHTGSVVGSVVGIRKYVYDVFGDGVNTASRMQALSEPMRITVSEQTYGNIKGSITCHFKGQFEMKGGDTINAYEVDANGHKTPLGSEVPEGQAAQDSGQ